MVTREGCVDAALGIVLERTRVEHHEEVEVRQRVHEGHKMVQDSEEGEERAPARLAVVGVTKLVGAAVLDLERVRQPLDPGQQVKLQCRVQHKQVWVLQVHCKKKRKGGGGDGGR